MVIDIADKKDAGEGIETFTGLLTPGFVNAHCHLELSHMKGYIPEKTGLIDFILKVVFDRHADEETILCAITNAENEMLQNGIVAVGDICNNTLTIPQKLKGNILYHNFIEASGFPPSVADARFKRSVDFYNAYAAVFHHNSIVPHAPYSVSPELFDCINNFSGNQVLTIHNQEVPAENELFKKKQGDFLNMYRQMNMDISFFTPSDKSSLQTYLPLLSKYKSLLLVHNVDTTAEDIRFAKQQSMQQQSSLYFCLCPNANQYISGAMPDVSLLLKEQCNIILGTDSLASNHQLNILEEIKTLQKHFPEVPLLIMLQWATINGAAALQMDNMLGSFDKNKKPGVVLIEGLYNEVLESSAVATRLF